MSSTRKRCPNGFRKNKEGVCIKKNEKKTANTPTLKGKRSKSKMSSLKSKSKDDEPWWISLVKEEEVSKLKKVMIRNKPYIHSTKTGMLYDYKKYQTEEMFIPMGRWLSDNPKEIEWI